MFMTFVFVSWAVAEEPKVDPIIERYVVSCLSAAKTRLKEVDRELKEELNKGKPKTKVKQTVVGSKDQLNNIKRRSKESIEKIKSLKEERERLRTPNAIHHLQLLDEFGKPEGSLKPELMGIVHSEARFVVLQDLKTKGLIVQAKGETASKPGPTYGVLGFAPEVFSVGQTIEIPVPLMVMERRAIEKNSSKDREIWWLKNIKDEIDLALKRHVQKSKPTSK
jgi:hypothetical protein